MKISILIADSTAPDNAFVVWRGFEQSISKAKQMGYHGIELGLGEAGDIDMERVRPLLEENGLCVSCISTGLTYARLGLTMTDPDAAKRGRIIEVFKALVDLAQDHGRFVNIGRARGFVNQGQSREEAERLFLSCMDALLPYAKKRGVTLLVEPVNRYETNFINSVDEAGLLIKRLPYDNMGIMADLFHMNIEEETLEGALLRNKEAVRYVHAADSNRRAPGMGHIPFGSVIDTLKRNGFDGWLSAEILPGDDPDRMARAAARYLREMLAQKGCLD